MKIMTSHDLVTIIVNEPLSRDENKTRCNVMVMVVM